MKLNHLTIRLNPSYSTTNAGRYTADIEFEDRSGKVSMVLDPDVSEAVLGFVGPIMTKFSTEAAKKIEGSIAISLAEVKQLPEITMEKACS